MLSAMCSRRGHLVVLALVKHGAPAPQPVSHHVHRLRSPL